MIRHSSGFICAPMTNELADRLELPYMVLDNQDPLGTAYTITVDASDRLSTGISAADRAHTLRVLADVNSVPASLNRPGHILPLRAVDGGVRQRGGHTEAAVDLLKLAGLVPVGAIGEIVAEDGEMMRLPEMIEFGERENVPVVTIEALIEYLQEWHCDSDVPMSVHDSRVVARDLRGRDDGADRARPVPVPGVPRPPDRCRPPGDHRRRARPTARSCGCTPSA